MSTINVGVGYDYETIADAMKNAVDGDTIVVKGDAYALTNEKVSITKSVTLKADGDVTVGGFGFGATKNGDVTIDGFTFKPVKNEVGNCSGIYQLVANDMNSLNVTNCVFDLTEAETTAYGVFISLDWCKINALNVSGCEFVGDFDAETKTTGKASQAIRASYLNSANISDNTFSGFSANVLHIGTNPKNPSEGAIVIDGNTITDSYSRAMFFGDISNSKVTYTITNNKIDNVCLAGCSEEGGVIVFSRDWMGNGVVDGVNVSGNIIENAHIGINLSRLALAEGATGSFVVENNIVAASQKDTAETAGKVAGIKGDNLAADFADKNIIIDGTNVNVVEGTAALLVDDDFAGLEAGSFVMANGSIYTIGVNAFATINDAVKNADVSEGIVEVIVAEGTYNEIVKFGSGQAFTVDGLERRGRLNIHAAEGAEVTVNGGFYSAWNVNLMDVTIADMKLVNDPAAKNNGWHTPILMENYNANGYNCNITISGCELIASKSDETSTGYPGYGVAISAGYENIVIENNIINAAQVVVGGNSIVGTGVTFTGNTMEAGSGSYAVGIFGCTDGAVISDNKISGANGYAIYVYSKDEIVDSPVISNNVVDNCGKFITTKYEGVGLTVSGNTITNTEIVAFPNGSVVSGNTVDGEELTFPLYEGNEIFVLSGLAGEAGDIVIIDGIAYEVGKNVYSGFVDAMDVAVGSGAAEIKVLGDISEVLKTDKEFIVDKDIVISADSAVTIALSNAGTSYDLILNSKNNNTITFGKNVALTLNDRVIWAGYYGNNVDIIIEGTVSAKQWWNGADTTIQNGGKLISSGEALVLRRGATLTVNGDGSADTVELDANYFSMLSGNLVAKDATIVSGPIWTGNNGGYTAEGGVLIDIDNTTWSSSGNMKLDGENVIFNIKNGSNVAVNDFDGYGASIISAKSQLNITGSQFTAKTLTSSGTITMDESSKITANSLTFGENGGIVINIEKGLEFGASTGTLIDLADGAKLDLDKVTVNFTGTGAAGYVARFDEVTGDLIITNNTVVVKSLDEFKANLDSASCFYIDGKVTADAELEAWITENYNKVIFSENGLVLWSNNAAEWMTDYNYADQILIAPTEAEPTVAEGKMEITVDAAKGMVDKVESLGEGVGELVIESTGGEIRSEIKLESGDIAIDNSGDLKLTGSVETTGKVTITNDNGSTEAGYEAVFSGGNDQLAAEVTANTIEFVNNGHAVVDFAAKNIEVENNSKNTIANSTLTAEESIIIDAKENADGVVSDSTISAKNITIADQTVIDSAVNANKQNGTLYIEKDNAFDNTDAVANNIWIGFKKTNAVPGDLDLTNGSSLTARTQVVVGENSTLTVDKSSYVETQTDVFQVRGEATFDGGLTEGQKVSQELTATAKDAVQGNLNYFQVYPTGTMTLENGACIAVKAYNKVWGDLIMDNSRLEIAAGEKSGVWGWLTNPVANNYGGLWIADGGSVSVDNGSLLAVGGVYKNNAFGLKNESELNIDNGSKVVVAFNAVNTDEINIANGASLVVGNNFANDPQTAHTDFSFDNSGIVNVNGGTVETDVLTNSGTINVSSVTDEEGNVFVGTLDVDKVENSGTVTIENATFEATTLSNSGTVNVSGESTLKIDSLTGEEVNLLDGAIVKNSTVGGAAFVAGNVTFRGDNTFAMLYDYGVLTDYYGTTAPMKWTVEEGASLVLTDKARYGLGYGDVVTINGNIAKNGAAAARETLTDDNAENDVKTSLFMHGLVAQESKGWDCNSSLTVNNAYVQIGSNNSFGNKPGNYGGVYTIKFNNAVLDSSRITFYEALSQTNFTFTDSNAKVGTFMTNDADSVFTLDNTVLLSTTTTNGTDEGNYNAGELKVVNNSSLTYSAAVTNKEGASINVEDSEFIAPALTNDGTFKVTGVKGSTLDIATVTGNAVQLAGALVNSNVGGNIEVNGNSAIKADADETTEDVTTVTGIVKVVNGATLTVEDGATFETKHIALGNDNYPTLNIGEVTGAEKGGNLVVEGTVATDKLNVNSNAAMTIEKDAVVTTGTIAIEDGGIAADENNKAGYLKIEDGGTLNTKYLNAFNGGKVDVEGTVNIGNDKRANYSTVVKGGGEVNVAATGLISGDGYNGKVEANGVLNINGGKVEFKDLAGQVTAEQGNFQNDGTINMNGGTFDVDTLTDNGKVTITNATLKADSISGSNAEANRILVEGNSAIEIGTLSKDLSINSIAKSDLTVTDMSIDKLNNTVRTYGNTTLSGAKINADYKGNIVSASGILNNINNVVIADNSKMYLNAFYARSGSIEAGSEVNAANFGLYSFLEGTEAANFEIAGTVNAVTFQVVSGAKNPESTVTVANGATVNGYTQNGHGLFDIQAGNLEVYGYVAGNWASGGGTSEIGGHGYDSTLTVDGTYAAADNNNGKFINSGDQVLNIFDDGAVNVINGATFSWANEVKNAGTITVDAQSLVVVGDTFTNTGALNINVDALTGGVATIIDAVAGTKDFGTVNLVDKNGNTVTGYNVRIDEANGDLILYKEAGVTVYVNAEWAGKTFGDAITYGDKTLYFGIDAFDTLTGIATSAETKNLVIVGGAYKTTPEDLTISILKDGINNVTADGKVVVNGGNLIFTTSNAGVITISGDFSTTAHCGWDYDLGGMVWNSGHIRFKGGADTEFVINGNLTSSENIQFLKGSKQVTISKDSVLTLSQEWSGQFAVYTNVINYGKMIAKGTMQSNLVVIGQDGSLTLSGKDASLETDYLEREAKTDIVVGFDGKVGSLIVQDNATVSAAGLVTVTDNGNILVDNATLKAGALENNNEITLKNKATLDVEDFDNNATLTLDGFTGDLADSLAGDKKGIVEAFGTNVITDNINTMDMYFGQKLVGDEDDDFEIGRETNVTIGNEENKVTVNVENFYNKGTAVTTVANGSTLNVGYIKNYGKLDVDGVVNLTTDASKGTSGIGRAEAAVGYDNTKSEINVTGEFNVNTNENATENNFVIYDKASLNVAGGTLNADEYAVIDNKGNFNVTGGTVNNKAAIENNNALNVVNGTINGVIDNNANLNVGDKAVLNGAVDNSGWVNVVGSDAQINGVITGGKVNVKDGGKFATSNDITANIVYVGYDAEAEDYASKASTMTISKGTTLTTTGEATINVRKGSTLNVDGTANTSVLIANSGNVNVAGDLNLNVAHPTLHGIKLKDGAALKITGKVDVNPVDGFSKYTALNIDGDSKAIISNAYVDLTDDAADINVNVADGALTITDKAQLTVDSITNADTVNVKGNSNLMADEIANSGVINVDSAKVSNSVITNDNGTVNLSSNVTMFNVKLEGSGDVNFTNATISKDSSFKGESTDLNYTFDRKNVIEAGSAVAFATTNSNADDEISFKIGKDANSAASLIVNGNVVLYNENGSTAAQVGYEGGKADHELIVEGKDAAFIMEGEAILSQQQSGYIKVADGATLTASEIKLAAAADVNKATVNVNQLKVYGEEKAGFATLNLDNAKVIGMGGSEFFQIGHASNADRKGEVVVKDSFIDIASIDVNNTSKLVMQGNSEVIADINNKGTWNVDANANADITGNVANTGVWTIDKQATVDLDGDVANTGTINFNNSTLNVGTLTNDGKININEYADINGTLIHNTTLDINNGVVAEIENVENNGVINLKKNSTLTVDTLKNNGTVNFGSKENDIVTVNGSFSGNLFNFADGVVMESTSGMTAEWNSVLEGVNMTFGKGQFTINSDVYAGLEGKTKSGKLTFAENADVTFNAEFKVFDAAEILAGATVTATDFTLAAGTMNVFGEMKGEDFILTKGTFNVNKDAVVSVENFNVASGVTVNVTDSSFAVDFLSNMGTINVKGEVLIDIDKFNTGDGMKALNVAKDTVISVGSDVNADLNLLGNITMVDSSFNGKITGGKNLTVQGNNSITIADGSSVTLVFDGKDGSLNAASKLNNVAIKGTNDAELTADDDVFQGNKVTDVILNLVDVEFNEKIALDTDLANIKTVNGANVEKIGDAYVVIFGNNNIAYKIYKDTNNNIGFDELDIEDLKPALDMDSFVADADADYSNVIFEMGEGTQKLEVKNTVALEVAGITKNENGGITNITLGKEAVLNVGNGNGVVEALGKFTTGAGADFAMGDVTGTHMNTSIAIGADNGSADDPASMGKVDLKGGNNSVSIGARSTVEMASLANVASLNLASGTFYKETATAKEHTDYTELDIEGNITTPAMNSTITLGNYAKLDVDGALASDDLNVGTTLKAGNYSEVDFAGDMQNVASINIGTESKLFAKDITGTAGNNSLTFGKDAEVEVGNITFNGGTDTINLGASAEMTAQAITGVSKFTTGAGAEFTVGDFTGTHFSTTLSIGADNGSESDEVTMGKVDLKGGNNSVSIGARSDVYMSGLKNAASLNLASGTFYKATKTAAEYTDYTVLTVSSDITAPAMNSTITLGNYAKLIVNGALVNSESNIGTTVKAGNYSVIEFAGDMQNVASINIGTESTLTAKDITGTAGNNSLTFGKDSIVNVIAINLKGGSDSITFNGAELFVSGDIKGAYKVTTGANATVTVNNIENTVQANNYSFGADNDITVNGGIVMNDMLKNTISIGSRSDVFIDNDIVGVSTLTLASGSYYKATKTNPESVEYTVLEVANDIITASVNSTISLGNYAELDVDGKIASSDSKFGITLKAGNYSLISVAGGLNDITAINIGTESTLEVYDGGINGTAKNDSLTFGSKSVVDVTGDIDLAAGNDTLTFNGAKFTVAGDIKNVYKITTAKGAEFTAGNIENTVYTNNYSFGANNVVKLGSIKMDEDFKNSLNIGADSKFTATGDITGAYRVTTGKNTAFRAGSVKGTKFADVITFGQNGVTYISSTIDLAADNDKVALGVDSVTGVGGISFGAGNDTLAFSKNAVLEVFGGQITGLENITGNGTNVIYLYNGATIENMEDIKGINQIKVVTAEVVDYSMGENSGSLSYDASDWASSNARDTFYLGKGETFEIGNLSGLVVSYLKDDQWYKLSSVDEVIVGADIVTVSLDFSREGGDLNYKYTIASI